MRGGWKGLNLGSGTATVLGVGVGDGSVRKVVRVWRERSRGPSRGGVNTYFV